MDALTKIALNKGLKTAVVKEASNMVPAGNHHIDTTVRVTGVITKGEDFQQVQHMKVDQWAMIAVLASKVNGVTIESVVREINNVDPKRITEIKAQAQAAMDKVKEPATVTTAGKVTTKLDFEVI